MADTNEEVELILEDASERMEKSVEVLRHEADGIRTGAREPRDARLREGRGVRRCDAAQSAGDGERP